MIIDAHNHPDWHGHDLEAFLKNMADNGIDRSWLMSWECPEDEYDPNANYCYPHHFAGGPLPFARCVSYAERAPGKFILGYAPDPRRPGAVDKLKASVGIYGVKVCGELKLRMMYDNPDALRLFRYCGEAGLPVVVHIDYELPARYKYPRPNWWYGGGIDAFERAVRACPETVFVGHAPGFWAHISGDDQFDKIAYPQGPVQPGGKVTEMLRKYPNLYCDLSAGSGLNALQRDPDHARSFLVEFQDRILFGRDYFDDRHRSFLDGLGLDAGVLEKIYSGNALKLVP